jgi:hypothetical protein
VALTLRQRVGLEKWYLIPHNLNMKKISPRQGNLIEPPAVLDFSELITKTKLSENEQGILKRRLIENRKQFEDFLQLLLREVEKETATLDVSQSLKKLEEEEKREIRSFDAIALLELMKDRLNLRQYDIQWGRTEERNERRASEEAVAKHMAQEGKLTQEQADEFLRRLEEFHKTKKSDFLKKSDF